MLEPISLQIFNIIKLKNNNGSYVVYIHIDMRSERFIIELIDLNQNIDTANFTFKLKDSDDTRVKQQATIRRNEMGDNFKTTLDFEQFTDRDIIELEYDNSSLVEITNFEGQATYNPSGTSEEYIITNAGLVKK